MDEPWRASRGPQRSFDDLPLGPETVAALAAHGIEAPTPFQAAAIPVIARGRDLLGRAGPGSGTMVAYGAPLIDRLEGGAGSPVCAVLCTGRLQATELARSFARLCDGSDLRAAALAPHWNLPERADFLFVPADRLAALYDGAVVTTRLRALVFHDGDGVVKGAPRDHLEAFLSGLPQDCQRIICGLPFGPDLRALAQGFARKAVTVAGADGGAPAVGGGRGAVAVAPGQTGATAPERKAAAPRRLNIVVADGDRAEAILALVANLLADTDEVRHVLLFAASADHAADLGDVLEVHGYRSGPPGDETAPVWLCPGDEEVQARELLNAMGGAGRVATVSCAVPPGAEAAEVRHRGDGGSAWVVAVVRELGHLRQIAAGAGMVLKRVRPERQPRVAEALDALADQLHDAVRAPELTPYHLLVESLADRFAASEVAAAALLLLDRERAAKGSGAPAGATRAGVGGAVAAGRPGGAPIKWVKLFASAGREDDIGPGNLLGALTSESGVPGDRVGRIDVRDRHSLIEVHEGDAATIIRALNGTTLGGRALRVDYDRAGSKPAKGGPARRTPGRGRPPKGGPPRGGSSKPTRRSPSARGASGSSGRRRTPPRRPDRS